jgi:hypothetical protein
VLSFCAMAPYVCSKRLRLADAVCHRCMLRHHVMTPLPLCCAFALEPRVWWGCTARVFLAQHAARGLPGRGDCVTTILGHSLQLALCARACGVIYSATMKSEKKGKTRISVRMHGHMPCMRAVRRQATAYGVVRGTA